jgi:outer membrane receptor protein involved in Fe transport
MRLTRLAAWLLFFLVSAGSLLSQTIISGTVTGTVTDPSGSVVTGATVVLRNEDTGTIHNDKTSAAGLYRFDLLEPGKYTLTITQPGFAQLIAHVEVTTNEILGENLSLTLVSSSQTVEVQSQAAELQTEDGSVSTTIAQTQVEDIPNSGNNMSYLTRLVPGYNNATGFGGGTALYTVDGMLNNDAYGNSGDTGANNLMLGLSEVKEVTISGSPYSGQAGGLVGPQVNFVTKGGTNRVHGSLNYWWTGRALIANNWFNKNVADPALITPRPPVHANEWSADFGFPVIRNRLFLYGDTEGIRLIGPPSTAPVIVPTPQFESATIAALTKNGLTNSIPFYQKLFSLYNGAPGIGRAVPGSPSSPTGCPTSPTQEVAEFAGITCSEYFQSSVPFYSNEWLFNGRGDFVISPKDSGFARVGADLGLQPSTTSQINPIFNTVSWQPLHSGQLNETHLFGSRVISSFLATGYWYISIFGPANVPATLAAFPASITFADGSFTNTGTSSTSGRIVGSGQVQDDVSVFLGRHTVKFGGRLYESKVSDYAFENGNVPALTVNTLGAFYNGGTDPTYQVKGSNPTSSITQAFSATNSYPILYYQLAFYGEDDWQVKSNLTLTASLRLDHQSQIWCLKDCITTSVVPFPYLDHSATIPYNQALRFNHEEAFPGGLQAVNWQPRIGFAYTPPILNRTLVVRGGIGTFVDRLPGSISDSLSANPPDHPSFTVTSDHLANTETTNLFSDVAAYNNVFHDGITNGGTVASIKAALTPAEQASFSPPKLYSVQNDLHIFQLFKWNLEVQKSFPGNVVASVNYLGDRGEHNRYTDAGLNAYSTAVSGVPTSAPDPRFGTVTYLFSGGNSAYEALIAQVNKRFHNGGNFLAGYTYSKSWASYASGSSNAVGDPYNPVGTWTLSPNDVRNAFVASYVYKLPFHNPFYGDWELSGTAFAFSGTPVFVTDATTAANAFSGSSGSNYSGILFANYKGGGEASCQNGHSQCLTRSEFTAATSVAPSQPVPVFRGPDYIDTDLSLMKEVPLRWESGRLSFGIQAYNILNHPNFANPTTTNITSPSFGVITATKNSAGIFSGVGGDDSPRILQVKGKIAF